MNLDPTLTLLATLAGAVSANQPEVHVSYTVYNRQGETAKPAQFRVALNSASDVTILAAPPQELVYVVNGLSLYNKDTASVTALLKTTDGSTQRIICRVILSTLESLHYSDSSDTWIVLTASGAVKGSSGISGPASSTNNGMVRWDGTTGTVVKDTSDITYDGTTYIIGASKFTVVSASGNTVVAGTLTGITGAFTKAAAGDVLSFTNGGATPVTGYLYSDNVQIAIGTGAGLGGAEMIKLDDQSKIIRFYANSAEQVRINNAASATRYITLIGSNGGNSEIDVSAGLLSIGSTSGTINIKAGGSTTISTGVGSVKMSTANAATNTAWIPIAYAGTTYYIPAWTTNAP